MRTAPVFFFTHFKTRSTLLLVCDDSYVFDHARSHACDVCLMCVILNETNSDSKKRAHVQTVSKNTHTKQQHTHTTNTKQECNHVSAGNTPREGV